MGERREDRIGMIATLASLPAHPESVPINMLVRVAGTPLAGEQKLDPLEFVRTIAVARITMPRSVVRLSAGREDMSEETQALCFLAGANSIFYGPKLTDHAQSRARPRSRADGAAWIEPDGAVTSTENGIQRLRHQRIRQRQRPVAGEDPPPGRQAHAGRRRESRRVPYAARWVGN